MNALPLWTRKFIVDFIETGVAVLFVLAYTGDPQADVKAVGVALFAAAVSAARRHLPEFFAWVEGLAGATPE